MSGTETEYNKPRLEVAGGVSYLANAVPGVI